jgi:uncharacterized protein (DUF608 family)
LNGDASVAAFPLGGIGTGNVSVGARGQLRDWEIFNRPGKGNALPYTFFALRAAPAGGEPITRVLESRLQPPFERSHGYYSGDLAGLPRLREARMHGEYPFVWVDFIDEELPVSIGLEAFTPLVPLDADESGLPAAVLRYRVRNPGTAAVRVTIVGSLANAVGFAGYELFFLPRLEGNPHNEFREDQTLRGLYYTSDLPADNLRHGTMALVTTAYRVTVKPEWLHGYWWDGAHDFWQDLGDDGWLEPHPTSDAPAGPLAPSSKLRVGSLGLVETLQPGHEQEFEFILAWHFPNRPKGWLGQIIRQDPNADQIVRNYYATLHPDAWAVAHHVVRNLDRLERDSRAFHDCLHHATLPAEVVDAVSATITAARSTTCFRVEDGTLLGWEGTFDDTGCCEGSCTHVWNYGQTIAHLFPELERSMRRVELGLETGPDGRMAFRTNRVFGGPAWDVLPAVDGQLGTVLRLYREWKFSGDDAFLASLWPNATKALEYAFTHWDSDGDLVLDSQQHNTYDIEFHGPSSLPNSVFYAALRAGAELAEHLGEADRASHYRNAAERGAAAMDALLWNGDYYAQGISDVDEYRYQYGDGCLSDQVFGQLLAHVVGLGYVLPEGHVKQAISAVFRHNFRSNLTRHHNVQRTYALNDEGGLLLCTWPRGGRPRLPFVYCDEVWTGVEYQVAAHLIYEGFVDEALAIVRAVRARYDGYRRNPWNEVECGNHYARSMASWALLLALSGYRYNASRHTMAFAPAIGIGDFACFFSTGSGWGLFRREPGVAAIEVRYGSIRLSQLELAVPDRTRVRQAVSRMRVDVTLNDAPLTAQVRVSRNTLRLSFPQIDLASADVMRVAYRSGRS